MFYQKKQLTPDVTQKSTWQCSLDPADVRLQSKI